MSERVRQMAPDVSKAWCVFLAAVGFCKVKWPASAAELEQLLKIVALGITISYTSAKFIVDGPEMVRSARRLWRKVFRRKHEKP